MVEKVYLPKISVVIPMYNAEHTIEKALNSVVNQNYGGIVEIVVVNDGSRDNSKHLVQEYISRNTGFNIRLINQENGGVSKARNTGLKNITGSYIALLDSDDAWLEDKLTSQVEIFHNNKDVDFLGTSFKGFGLKNKQDGDLIKINFKELLFKNYFQPSTILFKKEVLDSVGLFLESQRYAEEGNYFMRIAKEFNCYFVNKDLIIFGKGNAGFVEGGLSANLIEMEKGELRNLKFVYTQGWINLFTYSITVCFSLLKFVRRVLIVKFN